MSVDRRQGFRTTMVIACVALTAAVGCKRAVTNTTTKSVVYDAGDDRLASGRAGTVTFDGPFLSQLKALTPDRQEEPSASSDVKRWNYTWTQFSAGHYGAAVTMLPPGVMGCDVSLSTYSETAYAPDAGEQSFKSAVARAQNGPVDHPYFGQVTLTWSPANKADDQWTIACTTTQGDAPDLHLAQLQAAFGTSPQFRLSSGSAGGALGGVAIKSTSGNATAAP